MNHYLTPTTSRYTKLMKAKMFPENILKLNNHNASN
jgi:hypothetical protein